MNLAELSIRRPVFISCLIIIIMTLGLISIKKIPVDLFPNVNFPVLLINTTYPGASPEEVETLVSKVIEQELNNLPGIKQLSSKNTEGRSYVIAEFTAETDIKYAEQQIRDRIAAAKKKLPNDVNDTSIKQIDPADKPILILALQGNYLNAQLHELADNIIKPQLERINQVGMVETLESSGREIHVDLDRKKLTDRNLSASEAANKINAMGQNIPIGKIDQGHLEKIFRSVGEYTSVKDIGATVLRFFGNDKPITINDVGTVIDSTADRQSITYVNGKPALLMMLYKQTGTNTIQVANQVREKLNIINASFKTQHQPIEIKIVRNGSKMVSDNVNDVIESILIGIILTIIVVYLFLGNVRSTFITGLALPTSLLGSFLLIHLAGFSINTMSLLALSLAVGLLIDDAIVVRENIFRHYAEGKSKITAALEGTKEVMLAVIATTLTVVAVFGPIGFLHGIVGGFFKEFGLTVCFAMLISLFDALTIAPMLSAYIGLSPTKEPNWLVSSFQKLQNKLEFMYEKVLKLVLRFRLIFLLSALLIFVLSISLAKYIPKTFVPAQDNGEFLISVELAPGTNLTTMNELTKRLYKQISLNQEIASTVAIVGSHGEPNKAQFFINMIPSNQRSINTTEFKQKIRNQLKSIPNVKIVVKDIDLVGGGQRPFNLNIIGSNLEEIKGIAFQVYRQLKMNKGLLDPEISYKAGKPETQIKADNLKLKQLGVTTSLIGQELRTQVEGTNAAVYRENGEEYAIRVRLKSDQRDIERDFQQIRIPNVNNNLVPLSQIAKMVSTTAPANIERKNKIRYIQISADIAPDGPGMGGVMNQINTLFATKIKLPPGVSYSFEGQAESFKELTNNMIIAVSLGILFIYLVLASLYESFITPLTIMLVLPLATCGAFYSLLITRHSLDIFSMIGCVLLLGLATKNSILLVDYTRQLTLKGMPIERAIIKAGITRLRPILMTTIALIAGMIPIAIGLNEASKQRTSMGIAVIGGLISSTFLSLLVVPAAYAYIENFRAWCSKLFKSRKVTVNDKEPISTDEFDNESVGQY